MLRDHSILLQIALVTHNDDGEVVLVLDPQNLLLEGHDLLKRLARGDGIDEKETLARPHVLFSHCRVFLLSGCIQNIQQGDLIVNDALLAVGVCQRKSDESKDLTSLAVGSFPPSIVGSYSSTK